MKTERVDELAELSRAAIASSEDHAEALAELVAEVRRLQALLHGEVCGWPLDAPPEKHSWRCALHTNAGRGNAVDDGN